MLDRADDQLLLSIKLMKSFFSRRQTTLQSPQVTEKVGGSLGLIQNTRPPNVPAKSPSEESDHRKQHNEMLQEIRKREVREHKKIQEQQKKRLEQEERLSLDASIWNNKILPNFYNLRNTKDVHELWWRGLPPSVRGRVWKLAINNKLKLQNEIYNECTKKLEYFAENKLHNDYVTAIKLDLSRTFPGLCVFQKNGPLHESLNSVLAAYCVLQPDVGYVQGMSFIAAIFTLNMDENDAFICFANLIDNPCHNAAFTLNQFKMNIYYSIFMTILAHNLPKIFTHFLNSGLSPDFYLLDWIYTIYAKALPLDVVCRIWDIFIRDGDEFLFKTAIGILHLYQEQLLTMDFVRGAQFLTKLPDDLSADELFISIAQIKINSGGNSFQEMIDEQLT